MRKKEPKEAIPKNHIEELLEERDMTARSLAKELEISTSYMSKLINHLSPVTLKLADKIGKALGVDPNKVVDLPFNKKFVTTCDEALLGSTIGWLLEAADTYKVKLSHQELSHWAGYVYKGALEESLNFQQTKYLAFAVIDIIRQIKE